MRVPRPVRTEDFALYKAFSEPRFSPDGKKIAFSLRQANLDENVYNSDVYLAASNGKGLTKFTAGGRDSDPVWSRDSGSLAFISKRDFGKEERGSSLYTIRASGGEAKMLYKSKEGVERPEWSADSKSVYFLSWAGQEEKDDVRVIRRWRFWFNGIGFTYYKRKHLFVVPAAGGEVKQVTRGEIDVVDYALSHDGRRIAYLASTDDDRPYLVDVFVLQVGTSKVRKLSRNRASFHSVAWSPDDSELAVMGSDLPAGFSSNNHVWVTSVSAPRLKRIEDTDRNKANTLNSDVRASAHGPERILWEGDWIYYVEQDGPSALLYRTAPGGTTELVVGGERSVEGYDVFRKKVVFVSMDATHPEELFVKERKRETALTRVNTSAQAQLEIITPKPLPFRASDGQEIDGWVMLPKGKRASVPAILYVHGGPKTCFGNSFFHEFQAFVAAGYAVLFFNPRGSDGYSEEFADIRGKYGTRDYQDLMEGLDHALDAYPQLDPKRVAIAGGSYGGYMANWAVGHTDRFRAAVADRSIANWVSMWGTTDIGPYFTSDQIGGDPWDGAERLDHDSPLRYAKEVKTPLMLVQSMEDYRCWMGEALQFFTALKLMGKEAELVLFPGENHDLSRIGKPKHRVVRLNHYIRWFDAHMKP